MSAGRGKCVYTEFLRECFCLLDENSLKNVEICIDATRSTIGCLEKSLLYIDFEGVLERKIDFDMEAEP